MIKPPDENAPDGCAQPPLRARPLTQPPRSARLSFLACEVFLCEIDAVFSTLLEGEGELLSVLFGFLETPAAAQPLNCVLAGYFSKLLCALLARRGVQTLAALQARPACLELLVAHVGSSSVCDVLYRLVGADDGPLAGHPDCQAWLCASPLLGRLLDALGPESSPACQTGAAELLAALARAPACDLQAQLASPASLGRLLSQGLLCGPAGGGRGLSHALDVAVALLDAGPGARGAGEERREGAVEPSRMAGAALPHFSSLVARLSRSGDRRAAETCWGRLAPPLGFDRLKIVQFLGLMVATGSPSVRDAYCRLGVAVHLFELLAAYPLHSALHVAVEAQLGHALGLGASAAARQEGLPDALQAGAVDAALLRALLAPPVELAGRIASLPLALPAGGAGAAAGGASAIRWTGTHLRAGYIGILVRLSNRLVELAGSGAFPWLAAALAADARWAAFRDGPLAACNEAEAGGRWLCGRPSRDGDGALPGAAAAAASAFEEEEEGEALDAVMQRLSAGGGPLGSSLNNTAAAMRQAMQDRPRYAPGGGDGGSSDEEEAASGSSEDELEEAEEEEEEEEEEAAAPPPPHPPPNRPPPASAGPASPPPLTWAASWKEEEETAPQPDDAEAEDSVLMGGPAVADESPPASPPQAVREAREPPAPPPPQPDTYDPTPFFRAGYDAVLRAEDV